MSQHRNKNFVRAWDRAFLVSTACTAMFYVAMSQPAMQDSILQRYTTEHAAEYVIIALLMWGLVDVLFKLCGFPREWLALREHWLPARQGREPIENARPLLEAVLTRPVWLRNSRIGKRLTQALEYVLEKGAADELDDHLHSLAQQDDDQIYANYTLIRFIAGVTPVLGFLGTVVHFGTALSGIAYDQMVEKLPVVVSEMGQAFNTTTSALVAAMSMMFALFLCERVERSMARSVDRIVDRELLNRFEANDVNIVPFLGIIKSANDEALRMIAANLQRQTDVWTQAIESVLQRFDQRQKQESQAWTEALHTLNERHEVFDAAREQRLGELLTMMGSRQDQFMVHIQTTLEKAASLREDFGELVETLQLIGRGEGKLVDLQSTLAKNLRLIHETQKIDDALHGLTAAIHLLTARHQGGGGHGAAAAWGFTPCPSADSS